MLCVHQGTYASLLSWPWSLPSPVRRTKCIPNLRIQEVQEDGTWTLGRPGNFETIQVPRSYHKLFRSTSWYLPCSCSSPPSLCPHSEGPPPRSLPITTVCLQPLWEPSQSSSLFRLYMVVSCSLGQVTIQKHTESVLHHQMTMNCLCDVCFC